MPEPPPVALEYSIPSPAYNRVGIPRLKTESPQASFGIADSPASSCSGPHSGIASADRASATLPNRFASWNRSYMHDGLGRSPNEMIPARAFTTTAPQTSSYAAPNLPSQAHAVQALALSSPRSREYSEDSREPVRPVSPTWYGWIEFTDDALRIIQACITRRLTPVHRRPDEHERPRIIRSGAVFVYDETTTGISRWTDDRNWSPSRVRGSFMMYRELDDKVLPGEKKKALKRSRQPSNETGTSHRGNNDKSRREDESSILGSHHDSYAYKLEGGLMKRTFSAVQGENKWSVISYYDPDHVTMGLLPRVRDDEILRDVEPCFPPRYSQLPISPQSSSDTQQTLHQHKERKLSVPSYDSSYDTKQPPATSYPTPPNVDGIPEQVSYEHEMPNTGMLRTPPYDSPSYSPSTSFSPGFSQQQYHPGYSPTGPQYHYGYSSYQPPMQASAQGPAYQMPQSAPMVDPRAYAAHVSPPLSRRASFHQQQAMVQQPHGQNSYHEPQSSYYAGAHDPRKYEHQQPVYGTWGPHDERQFPPPRYARPN